jgi:hypothetical protein
VSCCAGSRRFSSLLASPVSVKQVRVLVSWNTTVLSKCKWRKRRFAPWRQLFALSHVLKCALINLDAFSTRKYLGECTDNVFSCEICVFFLQRCGWRLRSFRIWDYVWIVIYCWPFVGTWCYRLQGTYILSGSLSKNYTDHRDHKILRNATNKILVNATLYL